MKSIMRYDTHCHIFTLEFALKEVKHIMRDMLLGCYPRKESIKNQPNPNSIDRWSELKQLLRWLYELVNAVGISEQENLNYLQNEVKRLYPNEKLRIIPLMMDFFYILAPDIKYNKEILITTQAKEQVLNAEEFQQCWDEVIEDFRAFILSDRDGSNLILSDNESIRRGITLMLLDKERDISDAISLKVKESKAIDRMEYYQTDGFSFHLNNLMELEKKRKGELLPFIAVDPRRPGIIEDVTNGRFFEGEQRFYGIKLYPRMGFHPECKQLHKLYQFCNLHDLPITTHCGMGGFPPGINWKWADYGNPINFESILRQYPNLKINFAHMGSSDPNYVWVQIIYALINLYDNAYTDISCYTSTDDLFSVKQQWDINPSIREKLLFGTDFNLLYFVEKGITLEQYYKNFQKVFSPNDMDKMMIENPARFMRSGRKLKDELEKVSYNKR